MRDRGRGPLLLVTGLLLGSASAVPSVPSSSCPHPNLGQRFDYVIIGGGTAGLVLANRLTENPATTVAVIEAGTFPEEVHGNWTQVPMYAGNFYNTMDPMMWPFSTTPQSGLLNQSRPYFRPKAFGGCSDINSMAYGHSSVGAHQMFADAVGDNSFLYDNMLEFYARTMNFTPPDNQERFANATPMYDPKDTSEGGGLAVTYPAYAQSWGTWLAVAWQAIGIKKVNAFINGNLLGHSFHMNTVNHTTGFRSSSEAAYLRPVVGRRNLALFNNTMAQRIVFNGNKEAIGVQVGANCVISARKEVLLSAGVFQSPQMLMVSGVGPKALLQSLDIPVIADRPGVGQNLREHIVIYISHQVNMITGSELEDPAYLGQAISDFNNYARGPLASVGGDQMAMEKIPAELRVNFSTVTNQALDKLPADWPEIAYAFVPSAIPSSFVNSSVPPVPGGNYATTVAVLFAPQSVGNVSIASSSNSDPPLINPAMFTHPSDVDVMLAGFKRVRQALASSVIGPALIGPETVPGVQVQTDEQILDFLRGYIQPFQHAFSSNKMGKADDPLAVVDSRGRVFGVKNLRVIDSSAFPFLPPGPAPQIQVYTLAEKQAADIKKTKY